MTTRPHVSRVPYDMTRCPSCGNTLRVRQRGIPQSRMSYFAWDCDAKGCAAWGAYEARHVAQWAMWKREIEDENQKGS